MSSSTSFLYIRGNWNRNAMKLLLEAFFLKAWKLWNLKVYCSYVQLKEFKMVLSKRAIFGDIANRFGCNVSIGNNGMKKVHIHVDLDQEQSDMPIQGKSEKSAEKGIIIRVWTLHNRFEPNLALNEGMFFSTTRIFCLSRNRRRRCIWRMPGERSLDVN